LFERPSDIPLIIAIKKKPAPTIFSLSAIILFLLIGLI
jgi:hypothetical protein